MHSQVGIKSPDSSGKETANEPYLALDTVLDRQVALALIKPEAARLDRSGTKREAAQLVQVGSHDNIVTRYDRGDGSHKLPTQEPVEPDAETGRGLLLVDSLSAEWGFYPPDRSSGKIVWAILGECPA